MKGASRILFTLASRTVNNRSSRLYAHHQTQAHPHNISCSTSTLQKTIANECFAVVVVTIARMFFLLSTGAFVASIDREPLTFIWMASSAAYARNAQITIVWLIAGCMRPS